MKLALLILLFSLGLSLSGCVGISLFSSHDAAAQNTPPPPVLPS